ncbi:ROK family protein [Alkalibacterium psychrotolerans]
MCILCFDIGGIRIKYAMINEEKILSKGYTSTPENKTDFLTAIKQIIDDFQKDYTFESLSFSFPGYINPYTGYAERSGALTYFYGSNIFSELSEIVGRDYSIHVENDANCAAIAEKKSGAAIDNRSFVLATVGSGFGGGIFINNELVRGFQYKGGEFGQMLLSADACKHFDVDRRGSIKTLILEYKKCKGLSEADSVTAEDVLNEIHEREVEQLVNVWVRDICVALYNVATVINPEKIIIGGGISAHPDFLPLVKSQMECIPNWSEFRVPIETCRYHNDSGLLGAYYHARESLDSDQNGTCR